MKKILLSIVAMLCVATVSNAEVKDSLLEMPKQCKYSSTFSGKMKVRLSGDNDLFFTLWSGEATAVDEIVITIEDVSSGNVKIGNDVLTTEEKQSY